MEIQGASKKQTHELKEMLAEMLQFLPQTWDTLRRARKSLSTLAEETLGKVKVVFAIEWAGEKKYKTLREQTLRELAEYKLSPSSVTCCGVWGYLELLNEVLGFPSDEVRDAFLREQIKLKRKE
jgi:hypothetical protein